MNVAAWGLVGDCGVIAEDYRCLGPGRYDAVAVWGVAKGGGWPCKLTYETPDDEAPPASDAESNPSRAVKMKTVTVERKLMTAFVNSTQHFGKGLRATPDARLDDGLADLCFLEGGATRGEMMAIFQMLPTVRATEILACILRSIDTPPSPPWVQLVSLYGTRFWFVSQFFFLFFFFFFQQHTHTTHTFLFF